MKKYLLLFVGVFLTFSCSRKAEEPATSTEKNLNNDYLLMAVLYHQQAAELRAVYYQTFRLARIMFDECLKDKSIRKKLAVITDIDETILDNSPYEAQCILENFSYPYLWEDWCWRGEADAIPGAVEFFNYVKQQNAEVFYISNRRETLRESTKKNLLQKGFPFADDEHLLMRKDTTNKEIYRQHIMKNYHVCLLLGDNLSDFDVVFEKISLEKRLHRTDSLKNEFGKRFIVLPNAMYGDWEMAVYNNITTYSESQKDSIRRQYLRGF